MAFDSRYFAKLDAVKSRVHSTYRSFGAERISVSVTQPLQPYIDYLGEGFRNRIIEFSDLEGQECCLRPDYTLATALAIRDEVFNAGPVYYDDVVYRLSDEAGVDIEQPQIGIEIFSGSGEIADELDLICGLVDTFTSLGLQGVKIAVGDVRLLNDVIDGLYLSSARKITLKKSFSNRRSFERAVERARQSQMQHSALAIALARADASLVANVVQEILDLGGFDLVGSRSTDEMAGRLILMSQEVGTGLTDEQADQIKQLVNLKLPSTTVLSEVEDRLVQLGVPESARVNRVRSLFSELANRGVDLDTVVFDVGLGRELSYYDGVVFEIYAGEPSILIAGGGRYDDLLPSLLKKSAREVAACSAAAFVFGGMVRPDRVVQAMGDCIA